MAPAILAPAVAMAASAVDGAVTALGEGVPAPLAWRGFLNDPVTDDLVARALSANLDIEQAAARLDRANAAAAAAQAALLPSVGVAASGTTVRQSVEDPAIRSFSSLPGFQRNVERHEAGIAASWEIDLFGSAPRRRLARANAAASAAELAATRVVIAAETATNWVTLLEARTRLQVAKDRLANLERQRDALALRATAGTVARLDLDRFEVETAAAAAAVPVLDALVAAETERLGVLIADPAHVRALAARPLTPPEAGDVAALSALPVTLKARPDVIAAGLRLEAAQAGRTATEAQRLPKVQLRAILATIASSPSALFTGPALAAHAGAGLAMPLFDFGRIDAAIAEARGAEREALAAYRQSLLLAAADVESAFANLAARQREVGLREGAARAAELALAVARANFEAGVSDLTLFLDVERNHLSAREAETMARAAHARALLSLLRATASSPADLALAANDEPPRRQARAGSRCSTGVNKIPSRLRTH